MHYDPLRLGPCPKDLSEWTSLPPPQHAPHTPTQQAQQLVPHTRIRVPFPLPRHNIRPAQVMKRIRIRLVLMLMVSPLPPTTVLLSAFLHGSRLRPSHTHACSCPPQPDLRCSSALAPPGSERPHHDIRPLHTLIHCPFHSLTYKYNLEEWPRLRHTCICIGLQSWCAMYGDGCRAAAPLDYLITWF